MKYSSHTNKEVFMKSIHWYIPLMIMMLETIMQMALHTLVARST